MLYQYRELRCYLKYTWAIRKLLNKHIRKCLLSKALHDPQKPIFNTKPPLTKYFNILIALLEGVSCSWMFFIKLWKWSPLSENTSTTRKTQTIIRQPDRRALCETHLYEILKFKCLNCWAVWIFELTGRCCRNRSSSHVAGVTLQTLKILT